MKNVKEVDGGKNRVVLGSLFVLLVLALVLCITIVMGNDPQDDRLNTASNAIDTASLDPNWRAAVVPNVQHEPVPKIKENRRSNRRPQSSVLKTPAPKSATANRAPESQEDEQLLVDQKGSLSIAIEFSKSQRMIMERRGVLTDLVVRIEPVNGIDPVYHAQRAKVDPETLSTTFKDIAAVEWLVMIGGVDANYIKVEPNKMAHLRLPRRRSMRSSFAKTVLVVGLDNTPVQGAEVLWMPTKDSKIVHQGMVVGRTDVDGQLRVMDSNYGIFMARHGDVPPIVCTSNSKVAEDNGLFGPSALVAELTDAGLTSLAGQIISSETGRPIAGAYVEVLSGPNVFSQTRKWTKEFDKFRRRARGGSLAPYPIELGVSAISQTGGTFHVRGVKPGANFLVVRHPAFASPEPQQIMIKAEGRQDLAIRMTPGVRVKGRVKRLGTNMAPNTQHFVGSFNKAVHRQSVARDGSFESWGHKPWQFTVGVTASAYSISFVELKSLLAEKIYQELRCDFSVLSH